MIYRTQRANSYDYLYHPGDDIDGYIIPHHSWSQWAYINDDFRAISGTEILYHVINIFITLSALYQTDMMFFAHLIWTRAACSYQGTRTLLVIGTLLVPAHRSYMKLDPAHPVWYEFAIEMYRNSISHSNPIYHGVLYITVNYFYISQLSYYSCAPLDQRRVSSIGGSTTTYKVAKCTVYL